MSQSPMKRIPLIHAHNFRDLGGFGTADKKAVAWNRLYRSDGLSRLNTEEWNLLSDKGIKTVIDLRSSSEAAAEKDILPDGIWYMHCPMQREELDLNNLAQSAAKAFSESMEEGYVNMIAHTPELIAVALKAVAAGLGIGGVVFHCAAGKDRTGVLAAVILSLLRVADEDIIADYQVSYTYNQKGINLLVKDMGEPEKILPLLNSDASNMESLLTYMHSLPLENHFIQHGFTGSEIIKLRDLLLEES